MFLAVGGDRYCFMYKLLCIDLEGDENWFDMSFKGDRIGGEALTADCSG